MPLLPLANNRPFLKLGIQGFAGDGKTLTAAKIAVGLHRMIGSRKPIAIYDTEKASKALRSYFLEEGIDAVVDDSNRSLAGWRATVNECVNGQVADILITDSVTHIWENFTESYREQKNRTRLQFEDWNYLKPKWRREFSETFVMAPLHIIFTGRAGFEYTMEKDNSGQKQITKTGIKMKAEGETAFEPDILVNMEMIQSLLTDDKKIFRVATVIKDRSRLIDGQTLNADGKKLGPDFSDFEPAIKSLLDGILVENKNPTKIEDTFASNFDPEKELKEAAIAEVRGTLKLTFPGNTPQEAQMKVWSLKQIWNVNAPESLAFKKLDELEKGLAIMKTWSDSWLKYMEDLRQADGFVDREKVIQLMDSAKTLNTSHK